MENNQETARPTTPQSPESSSEDVPLDTDRSQGWQPGEEVINALTMPINRQHQNNAGRNDGRPISVDQDVEEGARPSRSRLGSTTSGNSESELQSSSVQPPPAMETVFKCPICRGPLVEEAATLCGHVFCMACLTAAISARSECPTCSVGTTADDIIRIFLPTS